MVSEEKEVARGKCNERMSNLHTPTDGFSPSAFFLGVDVEEELSHREKRRMFLSFSNV